MMQGGMMGMMPNMNPFGNRVDAAEKKKVEGYELSKQDKDKRFKQIQDSMEREKKPAASISAQQVQIYSFFTFVFGAIIYFLVQSVRLSDEDAQLEPVKDNKVKRDD